MSVSDKLKELKGKGKEAKEAFSVFVSAPTPENQRAVERITEEVVFSYQQLLTEIHRAKVTDERVDDLNLQVRVKCKVCKKKVAVALPVWLASPHVFCSGECDQLYKQRKEATG